MRWTLLPEPRARAGWHNMALDAALLDLSERHQEGFLRLYQWDPHCLSFGRHEPAMRRYDRDRIESLGIDVVRRPTGGRAVWHAGELTYAVAAPVPAFGSLATAYRIIHQSLCLALEQLGVMASLAPAKQRSAGLDAGACFAQPVGGEIMVDGRKVVGSAQLGQRNAFLQHGSILLDDDQELVAGVTRGRAPCGIETPINRLLTTPVSASDAADAVALMAREWPGDWGADEREAERGKLADKHAVRFRDAQWTWRR